MGSARATARLQVQVMAAAMSWRTIGLMDAASCAGSTVGSSDRGELASQLLVRADQRQRGEHHRGSLRYPCRRRRSQLAAAMARLFHRSRSMTGARDDGSRSFYFFDIDDNLVFLDTKVYLWNAETCEEKAISTAEFAVYKPQLGLPGPWQAWSERQPQTFRDFRDAPDTAARDQIFVKDLLAAVSSGNNWCGPSWPLLEYASRNQRPIAVISARGHQPSTILEGFKLLVERGLLTAVPPIVGIYTVSNPEVCALIGATDPAMTVPSLKKLAIKFAVDTALAEYGRDLSHRFGMSDDDPANVVLIISAMRDCKVAYPSKRFFVINTNRAECVKLEVFRFDDPVAAVRQGMHIL
jgi:hypothetical protein